jgi:recombination protein RecA
MEAAMKTTLLLKLIASHQRLYPAKRCVLFDVEQRMMRSWAEVHGVKWEDLLYVRPTSGEQVVDLAEGMMEAEDIGLIGIDSIAAMMGHREQEAGAETQSVGGNALLMNKMCRKMSRQFGQATALGITPTVVLINQIRMKIGVMYGSPETVPGGMGMQFMSSMTIRVSGSDEFAKKGDKMPTFRKIHATIKKNSVPILNKNAVYMVALKDLPELNLKLGQAYDWNTVLLYLKKLGLLLQVKDGWELQALVAGAKMVYPTQDVLKDRYQDDTEFGGKVRKAIIETALAQGDPITENDE